MAEPNKELIALVNQALEAIDDPDVLKQIAKRAWDLAR
jgi:hypothetical protein